VVEQWNSANVAIHYGREAELPGADREDQRSPCSRCTCCNRRWCWSTLAWSTGSWPIPSGPVGSPNTTCAASSRSSGRTWPLHGMFELDLDRRIDYDRGPTITDHNIVIAPA
jgi:hypothetical protein